MQEIGFCCHTWLNFVDP